MALDAADDRPRSELIDPFEHVDRLDLPGRPPVGGRLIGRWADRARPWVEWYGVRRLVATAITVVALVAGGWWLLRAPAPPTEAGLPYAATSTTVASVGTWQPATTGIAADTPATTTAATVVVHVAGAVVQPGVYLLPGGSRADAAVAAAGGAVAGADPNALNLAAPVLDGERIYVPLVGEPTPAPVAPVPAAATSPPGPPGPPGPIDLNRATADELDTLPGIGPATAAAIVEHRETVGPFATVDDLEDVRGIGPAKLDAIRELVTV